MSKKDRRSKHNGGGSGRAFLRVLLLAAAGFGIFLAIRYLLKKLATIFRV